MAAIFAGTIFFLMAYDYISANVFFKNNSWLIVIISIVLSFTALWFFGINGQLQNVTAKLNFYVPGNESMTYTFFITFILAALFSWYTRLPQLSKNKNEESK